MGEEMKTGTNEGSCGCGGNSGKCMCGGNKCCCRCVKKMLCSIVLLLVGGVIGYLMGTHCAYSRYMMKCPVSGVVAVPVAPAPTK